MSPFLRLTTSRRQSERSVAIAKLKKAGLSPWDEVCKVSRAEHDGA